MRTFKVSFRIDAEMLPCIAEVLHDKRVMDLSMIEAGPEPQSVRRKPKLRVKVDTAAGGAIIDHLRTAKGPVHCDVLAPLVLPHGLAASSASPLLSGLCKAGYIKRVSKGVYQING